MLAKKSTSTLAVEKRPSKLPPRSTPVVPYDRILHPPNAIAVIIKSPCEVDVLCRPKRLVETTHHVIGFAPESQVYGCRHRDIVRVRVSPPVDRVVDAPADRSRGTSSDEFALFINRREQSFKPSVLGQAARVGEHDDVALGTLHTDVTLMSDRDVSTRRLFVVNPTSPVVGLSDVVECAA